MEQFCSKVFKLPVVQSVSYSTEGNKLIGYIPHELPRVLYTTVVQLHAPEPTSGGGGGWGWEGGKEGGRGVDFKEFLSPSDRNNSIFNLLNDICSSIS